MKRLSKGIRNTYPPVKIYLDDVITIFDILKESCKEVTIEAETSSDKYQLTDPAQLKGLKVEVIHDLTLSAHSPYISVSFEPHDVSIYLDDNSVLNMGILTKLEQVISKRRRNILAFINRWYSNMIVLPIAFGMLFYLLSHFVQGLTLRLILGLLIVVYLLLFGYSFVNVTRYYSTILTSEKEVSINFYTRNRDKIFVGIIVAIITSIFTLILTMLFR